MPTLIPGWRCHMLVTLTSKIRILPDEKTADLLAETMRAYTDACNYVSQHVFSSRHLQLRRLHDDLYRDIRVRFSLRSQMTESVIRTVAARYKALLSSRKPLKLIRFNKPQYDLVWNRDYTLKNGVFSVNTLEGRRKIPFLRPGSSLDGKLGTAKLVYRHGFFFLHVSVTHEVRDVENREISNVVGIDRGIRFLAAAYDSQGKSTFFSGGIIKAKRAHYAALRKELQQVGTPSARRRLKAIGQRENRWMRDVNHCISKALVKRHPAGTLFVLEDLSGIRRATERIKQKHRYVSVSWSFYDFEQKLMYKAVMREQKVIRVDPAYTSQTCPCCGHTEGTNRDKRRHVFRCIRCGYTSNDDRIAAMNLYRKGKEYLVQSGKSMPLTGGAESTVPDVTPAIWNKNHMVTNAGGVSRLLQGSHKPPLLQVAGS